jgi:hypothetical protein
LTRIFKIYSTVTVIFLVATAFLAVPVFAEQGSAISSAQDTFKGCYDAIKQAQAAGANVNSLMTTLNEAAGLLAKAQLAEASGDYSSANNYAVQSQNQLNGFISQADSLKENAMSNSNQNLIIAIFSIIISVAILCAGIALFVVLNRKGGRT